MPYSNKEKNKACIKEYILKNKDTDEYKKAKRKDAWKRNNIKIDCFETLWEHYINTTNCEWCNKLFIGINKCLEHNHSSGEIRGIVCKSCNYNQFKRDDKFKRVLIQLKSKLK